MIYSKELMKKIVMGLVLIAILVPSVVSALDVGMVSIDVGVPLLYVNKNLIVDESGGRAPIWGLILGNLRSGVEADFIFEIVPSVFGLGANVGALFGIGSQPGTRGAPTFIADIPIRIAARLEIPGITGYVQVHGGVILENVLNAGLTSFNALRNIDLGVRLRFSQIAIEGGYLFALPDVHKNANLLVGTDIPFYIGLYIPII